MDIRFEKEYLSDLYFKGTTSDKRHRYQPQIIRKYIRVIDVLRASDSVVDLLKYHGLNYERLKADKEGLESVRVNDKYRIEFKSEQIEDEIKLTICHIIELSNHYK